MTTGYSQNGRIIDIPVCPFIDITKFSVLFHHEGPLDVLVRRQRNDGISTKSFLPSILRRAYTITNIHKKPDTRIKLNTNQQRASAAPSKTRQKSCQVHPHPQWTIFPRIMSVKSDRKDCYSSFSTSQYPKNDRRISFPITTLFFELPFTVPSHVRS